MISFNCRFILGILFFALGVFILPMSHGRPWLDVLAMGLLLCGGALIRYARSNKNLRQILLPSGAEPKLDSKSRPLARKAMAGVILFFATILTASLSQSLYSFPQNNIFLFIFLFFTAAAVALTLIYPYLTYLWSYRKQAPRSLTDPPPWWDREP